MAGTATWLKQISGALCALLLMAFAVVPAADAILCAPDAASAAGVPAVAGQAAASSDDHAQDGHRDGGEVCAHGHCHHPGQAVAPLAGGRALKPVASLRLAPAIGVAPPSNLPDGPEEPPRA